MDIKYTITIEETDDENKAVEPIKENPAWNVARLIFILGIPVSVICVIVSIATDYGKVSTMLAFGSILFEIILFEILVCHTFNMADKEREAYGRREKRSYPYLGM